MIKTSLLSLSTVCLLLFGILNAIEAEPSKNLNDIPKQVPGKSVSSDPLCSLPNTALEELGNLKTLKSNEITESPVKLSSSVPIVIL